MYCRKCGNKIPEGDKFCRKCGTPVDEVTKIEYTTPPRKPKTWILIVVVIVLALVIAAVVVFVVLPGFKNDRQAQVQTEQNTVEQNTDDQNQIPTETETTEDNLTVIEAPTTPTEKQTISASFSAADVRAGDTIPIGVYESDGNTANGKETLYWEVLAVDGDKALVITEDVIDAMSFSKSDVPWNESMIRQWLNSTFIEQAFSSSEANRILSTTISTKANPVYRTSSGADCTDKVFLLSGEEAANYFGSDANRKETGTRLAVQNRLFVSNTGYCRWWLRDAGYNSGFASVINGDGVIDYYGANVGESRYGVRPAMWISISDTE